MNSNDQIIKTYRNLRIGLGSLGFVFPLIFLIWTWLRCERWTPGPSISSYYHSTDGYIRDIFVGVLIAIGVFLVLYRGFSSAEEWFLNIAGICAVGIALFPTGGGSPCAEVQEADSVITTHGVFAVTFFLSVALVIFFGSKKSLPRVADEKQRERFRRVYITLSILMVALPIGSWLWITGIGASYATFILEAFAIWVFAAYWVTKTIEFWGKSGSETCVHLALRER